MRIWFCETICGKPELYPPSVRYSTSPELPGFDCDSWMLTPNLFSCLVTLSRIGIMSDGECFACSWLTLPLNHAHSTETQGDFPGTENMTLRMGLTMLRNYVIHTASNEKQC